MITNKGEDKMSKVRTYFVAFTFTTNGGTLRGHCTVNSILTGRNLVDKIKDDLEEELDEKSCLPPLMKYLRGRK